MNSSGITGTDNFVMQDATQLIKNSGLRRVAGAITDVAALGERAVYGHGRQAPASEALTGGRQAPASEALTGGREASATAALTGGRVHPQCTCGKGTKGTKKPRKRKNNKKIN